MVARWIEEGQQDMRKEPILLGRCLVQEKIWAVTSLTCFREMVRPCRSVLDHNGELWYLSLRDESRRATCCRSCTTQVLTFKAIGDESCVYETCDAMWRLQELRTSGSSTSGEAHNKGIQEPETMTEASPPFPIYKRTRQPRPSFHLRVITARNPKKAWFFSACRESDGQ
jgi:hypothetical protein